MRRREFIAGLGIAAAWSVAAGAQQSKVPVIGYLSASSPDTGAGELAGFREGLGEVGYIEGRNVMIELRWASGRYDRLPEMATELVRRQVAVIAAISTSVPGLAAKAASTTIPIVFQTGGDPVKDGLVANLNRPGGNVTGVSSMNAEIRAKRLRILHELVPADARFALLVNPNSSFAESVIAEVQSAASVIARQLEVFAIGDTRDFEMVFASLAQRRIDALLIAPDALFNDRRVQLAILAARHGMATISWDRLFPEAGGLMSYGTNLADTYRQVGQGRQAHRPAGRAADQVRVRHQPANCAGAWHPGARNAVGHGRRGDPMIRRRDFIAGLGSAAAWPLMARAQRPAMPVIGFLSAQSAELDHKNFTIPFLQGLKETGYVDGQNVAVEYGYAENQYDRLPALAADLVRRRVAVIVAAGAEPALAAKAATTTIPIVFTSGADPVALGLVASLNRPGANLTGSAVLEAELAPKRLQLLRELSSTTARFGVLADPAYPPTQSIITALQAAALTLGRQLLVVNAGTDNDLETAFITFSQQRAGAVLVLSGNFFNRHTEQVVALAARLALPAIFPFREYVLAGGLMSYGSSIHYGFHQMGIYTGHVLKGEKPADLPVQQATKLDLIINLKAAKALGLTIPETLLATADEVIQ
jgi:putative ABC transport system substrate-binding protein